MDGALGALYDNDKGGGGQGNDRRGGLGGSAPRVARWLGDIRTYFPSTVVQVMQRDAIERLRLTQLLLEPELLETVEPDVHLVGTLLSLNRVMPEHTRRRRGWSWRRSSPRSNAASPTARRQRCPER